MTYHVVCTRLPRGKCWPINQIKLTDQFQAKWFGFITAINRHVIDGDGQSPQLVAMEIMV